MEPEDLRLLRRGSTAWCLELSVEVIDPDGWDRSNLDESWLEPITLDEFVERVMRSRVRTLGSLPYVSAAAAGVADTEPGPTAGDDGLASRTSRSR